jgi:hypothetical protein
LSEKHLKYGFGQAFAKKKFWYFLAMIHDHLMEKSS